MNLKITIGVLFDKKDEIIFMFGRKKKEKEETYSIDINGHKAFEVFYDKNLNKTRPWFFYSYSQPGSKEYKSGHLYVLNGGFFTKGQAIAKINEIIRLFMMLG